MATSLQDGLSTIFRAGVEELRKVGELKGAVVREEVGELRTFESPVM